MAYLGYAVRRLPFQESRLTALARVLDPPIQPPSRQAQILHGFGAAQKSLVLTRAIRNEGTSIPLGESSDGISLGAEGV